MLRQLALLASLVATTAAVHLPLTQYPAECYGYDAPEPNAQTYGFANIVKTGSGSGKVNANVVLQGAVPGTYGIRLIQVGGVTFDCGDYTGNNPPYEFFLTTDSSGNGNQNINEDYISKATAAWVALNHVDDGVHTYTTYYNTPLAQF